MMMTVPTIKRCRAIKRNRRQHSRIAIRRHRSIGKILPPLTIHFMATMCGTARDKATGDEYELLHSMTGLPIIESKRTGKTWTCEWEDLIRIAITAGIARGGKQHG